MNASKFIFPGLFKILLITVINSVVTTSLFAEPLLVAVCANFRFAAEEIKASYLKTYPGEIALIIHSSGKLTHMIENGAPFHVFLSANKFYARYLFEKGHGLFPPKVYAVGCLIAASLKPIEGKDLISKVRNSDIIAYSNPVVAPYGKAAEEFLKRNNLYYDFIGKTVYGESISQINQFLLNGSVPLCFTSSSLLYSQKITGDKVHYIIIPEEFYSPLEQSGLILKFAGNSLLSESISFFEYLLGKEGMNIIQKHGYRS